MANKLIYYKQCYLEKNLYREIAWIPESLAKKGKILELKMSGDSWSKNWKVTEVYTPRLSAQQLLERSRDFLHTREASDI